MQGEVKDGLEKNFLMNPLELYDLNSRNEKKLKHF